MTSSDKELDRALAGKTTPEGDTAELVDVARRLEGTFDVEAPRADAQKALFAAAVGARRRPTLWRYLAPAVAITSLLAVVYFAGRVATPGNALYPVRKALQQVDLAPQVGDQVDLALEEARAKIAQAETRVEDAPNRAVELATAALKDLGRAEGLLTDLPAQEREASEAQSRLLQDRALAVILAAFEEDEPEHIEEAADDLRKGGDDDSESDDDSGSGSDDDDDNSGSGSGSDDNSGSGSDDSSGSGSGGSDDSSGPGSGDDD